MTMPTASGQPGDFATTRWSLVMHLDAPRARGARDALAELCIRYWYPVYAYVRRCGHAPETAHGITRAFLHDLTRPASTSARPLPSQRFRDFLLDRLHGFLAGDWRTRLIADAMDAEPAVADLEARNHRENADAGTPQQAYQRSFANEVITYALMRLRDEAASNGHLDMYDALLPFLSDEPGPGDYDELALHLGSRPLALVVALKRLRQRFRELAANEIGDTVGSPEDLVDEQKTLHDALRPAD